MKTLHALKHRAIRIEAQASTSPPTTSLLQLEVQIAYSNYTIGAKLMYFYTK